MNTQEKLNIIFSRFIVIFGGEYGRCKSLSETCLVFLEILHTNKKQVVSNMPIYYPTIKNLIINPLIETKQFDLREMDKIQNSIMIWDELHNDLFSRNFSTEKNKFIPNISVGFRKDNIKLIGSLQFFDTLEKLIGLMLEMIIIPTFINKYSDDSDDDRKIRLEQKDFWVNWKCIDKKQNNNIFEIQINLYPFLTMYNTNFKPYPLVITHKDYLEKLAKNKSKYYQEYIISMEDKKDENIDNWNKGLKGICLST